ncbi:hypothetical protein HII31_00864 [Pseudocercospora fuligena]|uniref:Uncharacterized protein n=1 Tax=Pseudocercospora fuligena TaxID=685502 RepID=A0A8H6RTU3_9PEZI|nr:hypothetical protein HII31_00864 [Pseudocercospora fuligena]
MNCKQDRHTPVVLASKPSASFSTVSSAASATSAGTSRSGGSRLLFGEIDTSSDRSVESYASVCSFVLCDSSTFLKFWLEDKCRETFLSVLPKKDLASLRLACHDFSVRAAPALFSETTITFKTNTFTKPSKLAELDRLGFYVKTLRFNLPHTPDTILPPLIEPETGAELSFTYTPQVQDFSSRRPKYGDLGTTEVLSRQYPALFHAATNVPAFIRAFSSFINLEHLVVNCPGYDVTNRYSRTIVDYALISLRIAVEKNSLNALDRLTLDPIHPGGLIYLSPLLGFGASPRSAARWSRIKHLKINAIHLPAADESSSQPNQFKLLQTYLRNFQSNLESFHFRWVGPKGPLPIKRPVSRAAPESQHPAFATQDTRPRPATSCRKAERPLHFPRLRRFKVAGIATPAIDVSTFIAAHKPTIEELDLEDIELTTGTWDDALKPLQKKSKPHPVKRVEDEIPIMLSPTFAAAHVPIAMERVEAVSHDLAPHKSVRVSKWFASKAKTPTAARKFREGLQGCEEQLRKVLRGSAFPAWR